MPPSWRLSKTLWTICNSRFVRRKVLAISTQACSLRSEAPRKLCSESRSLLTGSAVGDMLGFIEVAGEPVSYGKSKSKGADLAHPDSGTAKRLPRKCAKPRRVAAWFLGGFEKFAVSSQPVAKSYKLCMSCFLICFLLSTGLLRHPREIHKSYMLGRITHEMRQLRPCSVHGAALFILLAVR